MQAHHPLSVEGRLIGVAVANGRGFAVTIFESRLDDLSGACFPSPEEALRVARLVLQRDRGLPAPVRQGFPPLRLVAGADPAPVRG
jgi:hypothetical protein